MTDLYDCYFEVHLGFRIYKTTIKFLYTSSIKFEKIEIFFVTVLAQKLFTLKALAEVSQKFLGGLLVRSFSEISPMPLIPVPNCFKLLRFAPSSKLIPAMAQFKTLTKSSIEIRIARCAAQYTNRTLFSYPKTSYKISILETLPK